VSYREELEAVLKLAASTTTLRLLGKVMELTVLPLAKLNE
jgi:hypothetical protein